MEGEGLEGVKVFFFWPKGVNGWNLKEWRCRGPSGSIKNSPVQLADRDRTSLTVNLKSSTRNQMDWKMTLLSTLKKQGGSFLALPFG